MTPTDELHAKLDELGVEYDTYDLPNGEHGVSWIDVNGIEWEAVQRGENFEIHALQLVTPEQAIAATVGNRTDLAKRLREVTGLHSFAELFGFSWEDDSDWTWHDVACAMADAVDAATLGAGTCEWCKDGKTFDKQTVMMTNHGWYEIRHCPNCGRRLVSE